MLITDGVPYPPEGQSNADIEKLIQQYPDIPLFLMILKGADSNLDEFDKYVAFWQGMQQKYDHVFVYLIDRPDQIQDTYNTIVALLQDTIATKGSLVTPGQDLSFYVSRYIDKVVITASYPPGAEQGGLQVIDPRGQVVQEGEAGVARFSGEQNPVEVISIAAPRLADAYQGPILDHPHGLGRPTFSSIAWVLTRSRSSRQRSCPVGIEECLPRQTKPEPPAAIRYPFYSRAQDGEPVLEASAGLGRGHVPRWHADADSAGYRNQAG